VHRDRTLQDSIHQHNCTLRNDQRPVLSRKTVSRGEQCACVPGITVGMDRGVFSYDVSGGQRQQNGAVKRVVRLRI